MVIRSHRSALIILALVSFIWGSEFTLIDMAMEIIPVNTYNAIRFALAGCALLPLLWFSKETLHKSQLRPLLYKGAVLGILLFIAFYAQTEGLRHTSVSNAGFITGLGTPLVPVLGFLLFRAKASVSVWIGVMLATLGLYFLTVGDKLAFNQGDSLVLVCAFAFAIHILLTGKFVNHLPVIPLTIVQLFAVAIYSTISAVYSSEPAFYLAGNAPLTWQQSLFTPIVLGAIVFAGLFGTAFAYWAQSAGQKLLPDYKVALVFTLEPIFACLTAWLVLDEQLGPMGLLGAAGIMSGMIVAEVGDRIFTKEVCV
ncbi:DMT family transporter [Marinomonas flavescens]|uniref:DMT family transporter n=1 Tax=Marinomonas flavescens TaxID=2529379 RepID=UPI0010548386|nr:DMT family transporter [Marinomonas flavescens]